MAGGGPVKPRIVGTSCHLVRRAALLSSALVMAVSAAHTHAQEPGPPAASLATPAPMIEFSADQLTYDDDMQVVTASGNVLVRREGERLTADSVTYNRASGVVTASGNVLLDDGNGVRAVADNFELNESLRDGVVRNLLLVLSDGSRLAAQSGVRVDGVSTLDHAVYSPCDVVDENGCPIRPVWQIKAVKVVHDPERGRVFYTGARLEMFGVPVVALPRLSHPDNFDRSQTGLLQPEFRISRELGGEMRVPWFWSIAPDRDLTVSGHFYTSARPVLGLEYRQLFAGGPVRLGGLLTYAGGQREDPVTGNIVSTPAKFRGALDGNGQIVHGNGWRSTFSARLTNDDNFLGHYQISLDTRLRSTYALEHFDTDNGIGNRYFAVRGWYFQNLLQNVPAGTVPVALPQVDFRWRLPDRILDGQLLLRANTLGLYRADGQSVGRGLVSAEWQRDFLTTMGQRVSLTGLVRGDVYHTQNDLDLAALPPDEAGYAGREGWQGRFISVAAMDVEWPFSGALFGGVQTLSPRVQVVAARATANETLPNEDSRAIDLEDTNLFALNRFPGYDRFEGGARVTYGVDWNWAYPGVVVKAQVGQSYRFSDWSEELVPKGTGISDNLSDLVGRISVEVGRFVEITQRMRLDRDSLAVRRNEVDLAIGSRKTFASIGYLKFNRKIQLEDLQDHEELRAGARLAIGKYWAVFGSAIVDLTSATTPLPLPSDGYQPIRHRLGVSYMDECFEFSLGWKRNYVDNPNARQGNTFQFTLKLRNLG